VHYSDGLYFPLTNFYIWIAKWHNNGHHVLFVNFKLRTVSEILVKLILSKRNQMDARKHDRSIYGYETCLLFCSMILNTDTDKFLLLLHLRKSDSSFINVQWWIADNWLGYIQETHSFVPYVRTFLCPSNHQPPRMSSQTVRIKPTSPYENIWIYYIMIDVNFLHFSLTFSDHLQEDVFRRINYKHNQAILQL